ncbi:MAG: FOG: TPR repeat [uncultured Sulfurovum sp.]|uniref:FOG: TPR repeat n=1 Tax=uncultured Sulfurovum sp. TaxID=269237 RepID=A0A6S6S642_9BACT|nr:MAG: FOG: TPR repeat [uncultured Sulfurovum sp.]
MSRSQENTLIDDCLDKHDLALEYRKNKRYEEAIELLTEATEDIRKPQNKLNEVHLISVLQDTLAGVYMEINEIEKAISYFQKSILNLDMFLEHTATDKETILHHENQIMKLTDMALLYKSLQEYDDAITSYNKIISRHKLMKELDNSYNNNDDIFAVQGEIFMVKAEVSDLKEENLEQATQYLKKAINSFTLAHNSNPENYDYLKNKSLAEITLADNYSLNYDKSEEALKLLETANKSFTTLLEIDPKDEGVIISSANVTSHIGRIYREFGEIYIALDYFKKALKAYETYLEISPMDYETMDYIAVNLNNIANIYISIDKKSNVPKLLEKAIEYYDVVLNESATKENSNYDALIVEEVIYHKAIAQIDLSRFYMETNCLEKAKALLETIIIDADKAMSFNSMNIDYINQRALALTIEAEIADIEHKTTQGIEKYKEAISIFDQALELKPNDLFTINHRAIAKANIVTSCIYANKKKEGDIWFEEAMKDYEYGINLSPTFTDMVINRADLLSTWSHTNKHSIKQDELLKLLEQATADYQKVLAVYPNHFSAKNNLLTVSSDIADVYKEQGRNREALAIYYDEVKSYDAFLNIYNNDLMTLMNAAVSKLLLAKLLIEVNQIDEALNFLKQSLQDYDMALKSDQNDMETLINKSLALREIIDIETSSKQLEDNQKLNTKLLTLFDYYFTDVNHEKDTQTLTHNMTSPLSNLLHGYYLSEHKDVLAILKALETTKAKTLKMLMHSALDKNQLYPLDMQQQEKLLILQEKLLEVQNDIRTIKITYKETKTTYENLKGFKNIPQDDFLKVEKKLEANVAQKENLYNDFHTYSKEIAKLLKIQTLDEESLYEEVVTHLEEDAVILYPLYNYDRGELQVISIYKTHKDLKIEIQHQKLKDTPNFSNFILLIKEFEAFFYLNDEKDKTAKIKSFNSKYGRLPKKTLELIFEFDNKNKIINPKINHTAFIRNYRYQIIESALEYLNEPINKAVPKGMKKIYFSPFGDLNMLPLHAIKVDEAHYLIDNYEVIYISSLSLWANAKKHALKKEVLTLHNLYVSHDKANDNFCSEEIVACKKIIDGKSQDKISSKGFKELVHEKDFNILHLSVHGKAQLDNPLDSTLLFKESKLSLMEIHGLKLNANLVILSACESNLAKVEGADELLAFERAFMIAGASNIISTFDVVDSSSTKAFLNSFYTNLNKNDSFSKAFQRSAIKAIEADNMEWMLFRFMGI